MYVDGKRKAFGVQYGPVLPSYLRLDRGLKRLIPEASHMSVDRLDPKKPAIPINWMHYRSQQALASPRICSSMRRKNDC